MRHVATVALLLTCACPNAEIRDETREACDGAYARLDALGCEAMVKELIERGCFDSTFTEDECDLSVLEPCTNEIAAFDEPLDTFLDRKCGPEGTKTIEWPTYDAAAIVAANAAKAKAEAAALAEQQAINDRKRAELEALALQAAKTAKVKIGAVELMGALSKTSVRKVVEGELDTIRECYGAALARAPTIAGKVGVSFVISGTGKVPTSVVQEATLRDPALGTCIAKAMKGLQFPAPRGGGNVIVTVPFTLSPGK
jgi:hypothetical protein